MREGQCTPADTADSVKCALAAEAVRTFGCLRFTATGWSMLPTLRSGDTLVVEQVSADRFRVGDVALVSRGGRLCAHRVRCLPQGSGNRFWVTRGDAMPMPDRPVIESELVGRVTKIIRSGKCRDVPANLNLLERVLACLIRRSVFAARAFVYVTNAAQTQGASIFPCRD